MSERGLWPDERGQGAGGGGTSAESSEAGASGGASPERTAPQYPAVETTFPLWPEIAASNYRAWDGPGDQGTGQGDWHGSRLHPQASGWYGQPPNHTPGGYGQPPYGAPPPAGDERRREPDSVRHGKALRSAAALLVVVAAAAAGAGVSRVVWPGGPTAQSGSSPTTTPSTVPGAGTGSTGPVNAASIGAMVSPAVVDVNVAFTYNNAEGAGTGIVLSPNGLVLTNNHVIDQSTKVTVTDVGNGRTYKASVLGYDSTHDVALLKLEGASGLTTAKIASTPASVGQAVVAVGNAGGTGGVPTSSGGTITALNQHISATDSLTESSENLTGLIETNADIQEGDSGGPLVNTRGHVIGVDTAASESFAFASAGVQGYSIPIDEALRIAKDIETGKGTSTVHVGATAFIGLQLYPASSPFRLPGSVSGQPATAGGLEVYQAVPGTPAAKAGIAAGDVLTSFNGTILSSDAQLSHLMVRRHPGDRVKVSWVTPAGQSESATITLAAGPPE